MIIMKAIMDNTMDEFVEKWTMPDPTREVPFPLLCRIYWDNGMENGTPFGSRLEGYITRHPELNLTTKLDPKHSRCVVGLAPRFDLWLKHCEEYYPEKRYTIDFIMDKFFASEQIPIAFRNMMKEKMIKDENQKEIQECRDNYPDGLSESDIRFLMLNADSGERLGLEIINVLVENLIAELNKESK